MSTSLDYELNAARDCYMCGPETKDSTTIKHMLNALEELARLNADRERETIALRKALRLTIEALTPTTTEAK